MTSEDSAGSWAERVPAPLVMVIDDHPENLAVMEADLEEAGYRVALAESGPKGLALIETEHPDLVLLDLSMPGMDGLEVCRRIRQDRATRDLPIIMVTGRDSEKDVVSGLDAGGSDYITKPVHPETLLARIRTQLRIKYLQDSLKATITELQRLQQMRTDFVAMITHDLKAPLTTIVGFAQMLQEGVLGEPPGEKFRKRLEQIEENGQRLTRMINDFLTFSKIETGRLELIFERVDLNLCVMQAISLLRFEAERKQAQIEYTPLGHSLRIEGDSSQIERALSNILSNAVKYSPEGSTVTVTLSEKSRRAVIEISDQGPGIDSESIPRLFDRYFRVQSPDKVEGTGLGLSIVKSIVDAHGGKIEVDTQPGQGTTFRLIFPLG